MKKLSLIILTILLSGIGIYKVSAQEKQRTLTIVPPTITKTLNPGEITEGELKFINDSNDPVTFVAEVRDYIVEDTLGTPKILPPDTLTKKYSAASWIGVFPDSFTVAPHSRQTLNYYLQVPLNASAGGHYSAVLYRPQKLEGAQTVGATVETQIGTLFYINVSGDIKEKSLVSKFLTDKFQEYGPVKIFTQIKNLGDLHVRPMGAITVTDLLGRKNIVPLSEFNIFPGAGRDYETKAGGKIMIGRYEAKLLASYGKNNNLPLNATYVFWVFPWKITTIAVLVIIAIILTITYMKKSKKKGSKEETQPQPQA